MSPLHLDTGRHSNHSIFLKMRSSLVSTCRFGEAVDVAGDDVLSSVLSVPSSLMGLAGCEDPD